MTPIVTRTRLLVVTTMLLVSMIPGPATAQDASLYERLGGQHAAIEDAALGEQERAAVPGDEVVGHLAPLHGPLDVAHQLARAKHVAARKYDRVKGQAFTGQHGRHGLVDQRELVSPTNGLRRQRSLVRPGRARDRELAPGQRAEPGEP